MKAINVPNMKWNEWREERSSNLQGNGRKSSKIATLFCCPKLLQNPSLNPLKSDPKLKRQKCPRQSARTAQIQGHSCADRAIRAGRRISSFICPFQPQYSFVSLLWLLDPDPSFKISQMSPQLSPIFHFLPIQTNFISPIFFFFFFSPSFAHNEPAFAPLQSRSAQVF